MGRMLSKEVSEEPDAAWKGHHWKQRRRIYSVVEIKLNHILGWKTNGRFFSGNTLFQSSLILPFVRPPTKAGRTMEEETERFFLDARNDARRLLRKPC